MSKVISVDRVKEILKEKHKNIYGIGLRYGKTIYTQFIKEAMTEIEALSSEPEQECQRCKELEALLGDCYTYIDNKIQEEYPLGSFKTLHMLLKIKQAIGKGEVESKSVMKRKAVMRGK